MYFQRGVVHSDLDSIQIAVTLLPASAPARATTHGVEQPNRQSAPTAGL